ncbi:uncharacterized protein LOC132640356 [Lycium barbarum]|uniref:uncharacterized protein LOC132640356 n=1 Tax=Lycium barbarum TaxID=112863 RepID=UPI00293F4BCA|nr:uncharacterized protein LOC132640356 [Lycium barbarum]
MEKAKKVVGSSSSSSFTNELFGPKEPSNSTLFGSVFGPPSTGLRKDPMHSGDGGSSRIQDQGNHYGNTKYGTSDNGSKRSREDNNTKDKTLMYQNEKVEAPCNLSSSIYYGGQDVCPPTTQTSGSLNNIVKKDGRGDGSNSASRGNWWEGSLYY